MKLFQKLWFRIIFSLLAGGIISELIHVTTGDPNRVRKSNPTILFAIILFVVITFGMYIYNVYKAWKDSED